MTGQPQDPRPNDVVGAVLALLTVGFATGVAIWWWPLEVVEVIFVIGAFVVPASMIYHAYRRVDSRRSWWEENEKGGPQGGGET